MNKKHYYAIDEKHIPFIVDMAKLYAVYERIPIDPKSEYFKAYAKSAGLDLQCPSEFHRLVTDTLIQDEKPPRMAILQPQEDWLFFKPWREIDTDRIVGTDYEVTYLSDELGNATPDKVYAEFNKREARPGDYYGHSVSVGDIIAYEKDGKFSAFYVDSFGFQELPEKFFDRETVWKIRLGLDVRQERDLLERHINFVREQDIDLDITADQERLAAIDQNFKVSFRLADLREVNRKCQDVLHIIYDYQQATGVNYGIIFEENAYYATRQRNGHKVSAADIATEYQSEIQHRLERVAQRIGQENEDFYCMEANPNYQNNTGEYPFFIQRYHRTEQGLRTPEEIVFLGEADNAAFLVAHMNAGTLYGKAMLQNLKLRQTLGELPLVGKIPLTSDDVEMENMALSDRIRKRTNKICRAMETAGYSYNEIDSAGDPDGTQYFNGDYGTMQFENETKAFAWLDGVVFDEPEKNEAVKRIMHPERLASEQAQEKKIHAYQVIDQWKDNWGQESILLTIGRDRNEDGDFYLAVVQNDGDIETIYREYEFDEPPTRDVVYGRFVDDEAMRDIDRGEAKAMGIGVDLEQEVQQYERECQKRKEMLISIMNPEQKRTVEAMEKAGFLFDPDLARPNTDEAFVFTIGKYGYPITFATMEQAREWIDSAELKDMPGAKEEVQRILHPERYASEQA